MTVEVKSEETQMVEVVVPGSESAKVAEETKEAVRENAQEKVDVEPQTKTVEKSSSFKEESNFFTDLKEAERKALIELRFKLEEAILGNSLFVKDEKKIDEKKSRSEGEGSKDEAEKQDKSKSEGDEKEKVKVGEEGDEEKKPKDEKESKPDLEVEENSVEIDRDISLWEVPLLPSKAAEGTDVILLKFLRAREFKVNEAFEMLKKTLQWRKEFKTGSILNEDLGSDLASTAYITGLDREGHPVCYNVYGAFANEELYQKTFGTEEQRLRFLRWRIQFMEDGIRNLDLRPGGVSSLLQINDLKNSPGPSKKELRVATKQVVGILQDNYPEFVARNIFINVPFWYYAFHSLLSPFLTQRTKSKFVFARPSKVTETLLKYIPANEIPVQYGGFSRVRDFEFSAADGGVSELIVKAGSTRTIEIPVHEVGTTFIWDLAVLGWEVNYKEEFVPTDEGSYTILIQKGKKMSSHEAPIRNTFKNNEPGKIVLTIENGSSKKKMVLYRYKVKKSRLF
ncbi:patellin-4-like [Malania oleifera]|uniref:patellin-4-like n=1 Tax=Malania oleifera TaxID=397392 RepID=UPI0025ADB349|nr:patellin-4-like [Malania oleifera]